MLLKGDNSKRFELRITGYEFPLLEGVKYDSDWLLITIDVTHPQGSWSKTDACMFTWEAKSLADWLESIADNKDVGQEESFMEPELRFELIENDSKKIRVYFNYEMRPPWSPFIDIEVDDLWIDIEGDPEQLRKAASSLRADLKLIPTRVG